MSAATRRISGRRELSRPPSTSASDDTSALMTNCGTAIVAALVALGVSGSAAQSPASSGQTRTLTDIAGRTVRIPSTVTRVAHPWHANNGMVLMMGAADKIVATTLQAKRQPWFRKLFPRIERVPAAFDESGDVNIET